MRILIIGAQTALGKAIMYLCPSRGCKGIKSDFDFITGDKSKEYILSLNPDCIIYCDSYENLNTTDEEKDKAFNVNCCGAENAAEAAQAAGAKFIYVSTDFVFDGMKKVKLKTFSPVFPVNIYGESKLAGERACLQKCSRTFIVRTSRLYGKGEDNYIGRVLKLMKQGRGIKAPHDVYASPTYVKDLAALILEMAQSEKYGVYHGVNEGYCSLYEMVLEIKRLCGYAVSVLPVKGSSFETDEEEPACLVLDTSCLDGKFRHLPPWQDALMRYLEDEGELL